MMLSAPFFALSAPVGLTLTPVLCFEGVFDVEGLDAYTNF